MKELMRPGSKVEFQNPMERMYFERLLEGLTTLRMLDSGNYPIDNYEGVPIQPKGVIKGLRFGIGFQITSDFMALKDLGREAEARAVIELERSATNERTKK